MFWRTLVCALALGVVHMAYAGGEHSWTHPEVYRANTLLGLPVKTPGGEGRLVQFVFNGGRVAYSVLAFEGIEELKGKYLLVPWAKTCLVPGEGSHFTLDITRERLLGAPSFTLDKCPDLHKPEVSKAIHDYYGAAFAAVPVTDHGKKGGFSSLCCTIGTRVQARGHEEVGTIEDVVIDLREGRLAYSVISLGGISGLADKIALVPWTALKMLGDRGLARVDIDRATLGTFAVAWTDFPNLGDLSVASLVHKRFQREPYWEVFGYAADRFASWQPGSSYNLLFNTGNVATYEGKIISIGSFFPGRGAMAGIRLVFKTDDNRYLVAHVGPVSHVLGAGFIFRYGDRIKLIGSNVTWDGYSIVMVSEIHLGDRVLKLRDAQGVPLWQLGEAPREG